VEIVVVCFIVLLCLIALGMPVAVVISLVGIGGAVALTGNLSAQLELASLVTYMTVTTYVFMCVPLFILMGYLASSTGIGSDLYEAAYKNVGRFPGGVAVATCFGSAGFGAITGSSVSTCMAMAKIALPEMKKLNYDIGLSVGCIASAGTFAVMIPPSTTLILFAIFAQESIGALLLAGAIPGILTAVIYSLSILGRAHFNPRLGPPAPAYNWKESLISLIKVMPFLMIIIMILAGILLGVWSPIEASAAGVFMVLIIGVVKRTLTVRTLFAAVRESTINTASVMLIIIGALIFGKFLALSGTTKLIAESVVSWGLPPLPMFAIFCVFYMFLGCFLTGLSMMALTLPVILPLLGPLGWSPIWFGIIFVKLVEIGAVTPPVGLTLYAMKSAAPDIPLGTIMRGVLPFIPCDLFVLGLLYLWPQIALWLPGIMLAR